MTNRNSRRGRGWLAFVALATVVLAACSPANGKNTLAPHGTNARDIDNLIYPIWIVAVIIGLIVVGGVLWVALRYRHKEGRSDRPKQVHGNLTVEILWTIIPAVILAVIAVPTIALIFKEDAQPPDAVKVTVIGKQWWWQFQYPASNGRPQVVTADELHIPTGRSVYLSLKACDLSLPYGVDNGPGCNVIHSFWVPELAGKVDVVPGQTNHMTLKTNTPGTYLGQCAQYCGLSHANMHFRVIVQSPSAYNAWLASQRRPPRVSLAGSGAAGTLFTRTFSCSNCHTTSSSALSTYGPNLTHLAGRSTFASGYFKLDKAQLIKWIMNAPGLIPMESKDCRKGPPGTPGVTCVGMPSFTKNTPKGMPVMTPAEANTLANYLLSLK
jgi:cytochrome c oxidase subunit 2